MSGKVDEHLHTAPNGCGQEDRRKHARMPTGVHVEVTWPGHNTFRARTRDLSHGGVFLEKDTEELPPLGAEIYVLAEGEPLDGGKRHKVKAKVVRVTEEGVGIQFIE